MSGRERKVSKYNGVSFKIEKGIPLSDRRGKRKAQYPFGDMKPGDSFAIPETVNVDSVRTAASWHGMRNDGQKFSVRNTEDGYRCWRVA